MQHVIKQKWCKSLSDRDRAGNCWFRPGSRTPRCPESCRVKACDRRAWNREKSIWKTDSDCDIRNSWSGPGSTVYSGPDAPPSAAQTCRGERLRLVGTNKSRSTLATGSELAEKAAYFHFDSCKRAVIKTAWSPIGVTMQNKSNASGG